MNCLPDINVWLALTFSAHPHHLAALAWFDGAGPATCAFCRMTQQGFLRLACNPAVFKRDALSLPAAWAAYDALREDERVTFIEEPAGLEKEWRKLTNDGKFSVKIWNDAFLAASAKTAGLQLVTFDKGFQRYPKLKWVCLD